MLGNALILEVFNISKVGKGRGLPRQPMARWNAAPMSG